MQTKIFCAILVLSFFIFACQQDNAANEENSSVQETSINTLFKKVDPERSRIRFFNALVENDVINYFNYTYLYNGSGVAALDVNNDGLQDLFFVSSMGENKLYLNQGNFRFKDITIAARVGDQEGLKTGVVICDINHDGYDDIYVCKSGPLIDRMLTNRLYINQKDGTFKDEAIARGLNDKSNTNHAVFFDYDNDNDLDLFLLNHPITFKKINTMQLQQDEEGNVYRLGKPENDLEGDRLYQNDGNGFFTDVSEEAGVYGRGYGLSVTAIDINEDGYMDLYVGNDFIEPDFLYINQKNGTFKNQLSEYFGHTTANTMGADIGDVNNDGALDLYTLDMLPEKHERRQSLMTSMRYDRYKTLEKHEYGSQIMRNMLYLKSEDGKMREVGNLSGLASTDWSWSPLIFDFDLDGDQDIFVTNGYRRDLTDMDYLTYYDEYIAKGKKPENNLKEIFEIVPSVPVANYLFENKGNLSFENKAKAWGLDEKGFSNGAIHVDLDNDGDQDIVTNNFDMEASIFENTLDVDKKHWLRVKVEGPTKNPDAIGAVVKVYQGDQVYTQAVKRVKGFLSSSEINLSFGLLNDNIIQKVEVVWPGKKKSVQADIQPNKTVVMTYKDANPINEDGQKVSIPFGEATNLIDYTHKENAFIDVKREPLIPRCFSREGPVVEVFDFNNDGLEDIIVGGAAGQSMKLYVQDSKGVFTSKFTTFFDSQKEYEDVDIAVFDADQDGYKDIFVASGGNAEPQGSGLYQDRLYKNENGTTLSSMILPTNLSSSSSVDYADIDGDGDLDVFVGGYVVPNRYPEAAESYVLINDGRGKFNRDNSWIKDLNLGMVSDAFFHDFDNDGKEDLFVIGEWMPLAWMKNDGSTFSKHFELEDSYGWWLNSYPCDIDADGDIDIVAGNIGLNTNWQPSTESPVEVFANDFDKNGKYDAILTITENGKRFPTHRRDVLFGQMTSLRTKFVKNKAYAKATIDEIVDISNEKVLHKFANEFRSVLLVNNGNGDFEKKILPQLWQMAPIYALTSKDVNKDGKIDLLGGGNDMHLEIETARSDALALSVLLNEGDHTWRSIALDGVLNVFNEAVRDLDWISVNGKTYLIVAINDGEFKFFPLDQSKN